MTSPGTVIMERAAIDQGIAVVTLNRPERANAFTPEMASTFASALSEVDDDNSVRGIVVTGAGRQFCAGMDASVVANIAEAVDQGHNASDALQPTLRAVQKATNRIFTSGKPIVAAINGPAAAGGFDVALACDYRVSAASATFVQSYARLGLPPLDGGAQLLRRVTSHSVAFRLLSTADRIDAEEALNLGIVDVVCPVNDVLDAAIAVAQRMSVGGGALVRHIKGELRHDDASFSETLARAFSAGVRFVDSDHFQKASRQLMSQTGGSSPAAPSADAADATGAV